MPHRIAPDATESTICPGFEDYVVSKSGGVYRDGRRLAAWVDADGYWRVRIRASKTTGRKYFDKRVSHLVAATWRWPYDSLRGHMVWPLDGDASNHHADNLIVIPRTSDAARFEKDTRISGDFDADQQRRMRRDWISREISSWCETKSQLVTASF